MDSRKKAHSTEGSEESDIEHVLKQLKMHNDYLNEEWLPREVKCLLNLKDHEKMNVVMAREQRFQEITIHLADSEYIGLTVIGERDKIPNAICLTAEKAIFVFSPEGEKHISYLKSLLKRKELTFFCADGVFDSLALLKCQIKLRDYKVTDLHSFDMHSSFVDELIQPKKSDSPDKIIHYDDIEEDMKIPPRRSLEQLVSHWLDATIDLKLTGDEKKPFSLHGLHKNVVAQNVIKKKAALVRCLGMKMTEMFEDTLREDSVSIYSLAKRADAETRENYDRATDGDFNDLLNTLTMCPSSSKSELF